MKWRRFWKGYFFLMVAMTIGGFALPFLVSLEDRAEGYEDLVLLPLYIAQLVGLFGLAYSRAIGTRRIWQLVFGATVLEQAWVLYGFVTAVPPPELGSSFVIGLAAILVPLLILLCVGLYSYAFREKELWSRGCSMSSNLTYPLGYRTAKRVMEAGRGAFFRSPSCDLPRRTSTILEGDDLVPQFGYVGTDFHPLRVLLLGINPGNGPENANTRSRGDEQMMPALHRFAEIRSPQSFLEAQRAYKGVCQSWPVWGRHCAELLTNAELSIDQIAYSNCLPWRTASKSAFDNSIAEKAAQLYAIPLIEELEPRIIVAVGKKAATILGYATTTMPPMVVWNRAQAFTESVDEERRAATARFCALLIANRRDNAT